MPDDEEPENPLDPEAWFGVPDVCGSCIAWRNRDLTEGDTVAMGACRLRPELSNVPATMAKCPIYKPRGKFRYEPGRSPVTRRENKVLSVVRIARDGTETRAARVAPVTPRPVRPNGPVDLDLGVPVIRQALVEMMRREHGRPATELHEKYKRGGTVEVRSADGAAGRTVPAEHFFSIVDRLTAAMNALEARLEAKSDALGAAKGDCTTQLKRARGSLTTFNVLFQHRSDYFSGK